MTKKNSTPKLPPQNVLLWAQENLGYEEGTGLVRWKTSGGVTHKHLAGDLFSPAVHTRLGRSRVVSVGPGAERVSMQYHQLCWFLAHGVWADYPIDHANRDNRDNRLQNLRRANDTVNAYNKPSVAPYKGVTKRSSCDTYRARISVNGVRVDLGRGFRTPEAAFAAYCAASEKLHGVFSCVEQRKPKESQRAIA